MSDQFSSLLDQNLLSSDKGVRMVKKAIISTVWRLKNYLQSFSYSVYPSTEEASLVARFHRLLRAIAPNKLILKIGNTTLPSSLYTY